MSKTLDRDDNRAVTIATGAQAFATGFMFVFVFAPAGIIFRIFRIMMLAFQIKTSRNPVMRNTTRAASRTFFTEKHRVRIVRFKDL